MKRRQNVYDDGNNALLKIINYVSFGNFLVKSKKTIYIILKISNTRSLKPMQKTKYKYKMYICKRKYRYSTRDVTIREERSVLSLGFLCLLRYMRPLYDTKQIYLYVHIRKRFFLNLFIKNSFLPRLTYNIW